MGKRKTAIIGAISGALGGVLGAWICEIVNTGRIGFHSILIGISTVAVIAVIALIVWRLKRK